MQTQVLGLHRHNLAYPALAPASRGRDAYLVRGLDALKQLAKTVDDGTATLDVVELRATDDLVKAREGIRVLACAAGLTQVGTAAVLAAASELGRNVLVHAGRGALAIGLTRPSGHLLLGAFDHGPGIPRLDLALTDGYSTIGSLGMGLPGSRRVMDRFEVKTEVGCGTVVLAVKLRQAQEGS